MIRIVIAVLSVVLWHPGAHAATAFDNFGPGFDRSETISFPIAGDPDSIFLSTVGVRFVANESGDFSNLWVAAGAFDSGRPNDGLRFSLAADDAGSPGEVLESVVLNDVCFLIPSDCPFGNVYSIAASGTTPIEEGVAYWILASADLAESQFSWYATTGATGAADVYLENGIDDVLPDVPTPPAIRVDVVTDVTPIPEPEAPLLLGSMMLVAWLQKRHFTVR